MYFAVNLVVKMIKALLKGRMGFLIPENLRFANREFRFDRDVMILAILSGLIAVWVVLDLPTGL
jgi:hypothetical protein